MTIAERNNKLKHFITCLKCEVSGKVCDENCSMQYDAGNMGEIIENLEAISKALEQEPVIDKIKNDMADIGKELRTRFDNIRAEIKAASLGKWYVGRIDGKAEEVLLMADVLQILDKYKAESEK